MLFDWNMNNNINVGIILDAAGFFGAVAGGLATSDTVTGVGAVPGTDGRTVIEDSNFLPVSAAGYIFRKTLILKSAGKAQTQLVQ